MRNEDDEVTYDWLLLFKGIYLFVTVEKHEPLIFFTKMNTEYIPLKSRHKVIHGNGDTNIK
jgi:hypothetical protein